jgi:AcrR family transcriptional regulator
VALDTIDPSQRGSSKGSGSGRGKQSARKSAKAGEPRSQGNGAAGRRRKVADLRLRRIPLQARGRATFERILDTTARLLDEFGTESITTNLVAKAAGVNVATLYQYFPNKQSLLLALFQRQSDQRIAAGEGGLAGICISDDWRSHLEASVDAVVQVRRTTPGTAALRQAMRSTPELLEYDLQGTMRAAEVLADELVKAGHISPPEAALVARCCIEMLAALLDLWSVGSGGKDDRIIVQLKVALAAYLEPYFGTAPGRGAKGRTRR